MLEDNKPHIRLSKAAKELNVGMGTILDFLSTKGFQVSSSPNTKLTVEMYTLLVKEFGAGQKPQGILDLPPKRSTSKTIDKQVKEQLVLIYRSLPKDTITGKGSGWVNLAKFGPVIKNEEVDFHLYGFSKLGEFIEMSGVFDVWDDCSKAAPIKYIREKGAEPNQTTKPEGSSVIAQDLLTTRQATEKPSVLGTQEMAKVKYLLRLKDDYFIGQFIPDFNGGYKIVDIRNTGFTKIEDAERNIRNLEISFQSPGQSFRKFAYYKFVWKLVSLDPLLFDIDLSQDVVFQTPEDIISCIARCQENYEMDAARKIKRSIDTLSKQLTQSGKEVFIYELLQNANDYPQKRKDGDKMESIPVDVEFHILDYYLTFQHTGEYFNPKNVSAICSINDGEKNANVEAIGYKGIGFKTVFLDNDYVFLQTGNYTFRFDKKTGTSDQVPSNTPWQIYPFWTPLDTVSPSIQKAFNQHSNDEFRVKFALMPRDSKILRDRRRKDNYIDLFTSVFDTERVMLFIPNIHKVSVFFDDASIPSIVRSKDNDSWYVSEAMVDDIPDAIRDRINDVLTNSDADKSNGYDKIPEKYLNFNRTAVRFACKKEGRKLLPVENANLFCYLPAKRANWGFDFLMNTDMIPNGARDDIEDIELNHEIAKIAGRQFFYWIRSLIGSGEYELDSIFSLIPDFKQCIERHADYKSFIEEFQEEFEELIFNECFVPVLNHEGERYVATINAVINDQTGITRNGVMSDKEFMTIMDLMDDYLPVQELRESKAFMDFLFRHSPSELDISFDKVRGKCSKDVFVEWLKDADNNNRFINHLLVNEVLEDFEKEKIFIEYEGDLFAAGQLYYDFDSHCKSIPFLRPYIPHLTETSRAFFNNNEDWKDFVDEHFKEFDANEMLEDYVFDCEDAMALLKDMDNSKAFFKFIAEYKIDLADQMDRIPYLDEDEEVKTGFDGLLYFYSENAFNLSQAKWLGDNSITILSHKYLEDDTYCAIKNVFKKLGFADFDEKGFFASSVVGDLDFCRNVNIEITDNFEVNVSFLKFVYSHKDYLKEKEGQLKNYVLRCLDIDDSEQYMNADVLRYFSQESYSGNTTFADNKQHSWLSIGLMYCLDNKYFDEFPSDERKQLESFFRQSFGIKTFTNKSFFSDVVIANKKSIYGYLSDKALLLDFIGYLKRDEKDIFDDSLAFNDIKDMPLLCYDDTVILKRGFARLVEYDTEAVELANKNWCLDGVFKVLSESYSVFSKSTLQFLKIEPFNLSVTMTDLLGVKGFAQVAKQSDYNVDFWRYIKANLKSFESLESFGIIKLAADGDDGVYLNAKELYISDLYQKDGIESLVRKYDESARFVSKDYLEEDTDSNKLEWNKLFKKLGLRSDNKDILFNSVLPRLHEIEDDTLDAVIAMLSMHLKDLKDNWANCKNRLCRLRVRTRSGQYQTLDKTIIINIAEENVVEPFKGVELQGEIAPDILSTNKDIIRLIAAEFQRNCIYTSKQQWAQAKLDEYIGSIQYDAEKREGIHVDFIRELAALVMNDFSFSNESLEKLLYKAKNKSDGYLFANQLTLGAVYKPICEFESNGIADLHYLSEEYLTENNKDTIRAFFKKTSIHQSFEAKDIPLLADRAFALYFWSRYFTRRLAEFEEWIEKGMFNHVPCIPTEGSVVSPEELYSPEIIHFVRNTPNWQSKLPAKLVVDSIREEGARKLFFTLPFRRNLCYEDCLHYLLIAKDKFGEDYRNRTQIVEWIMEDDNREESLMQWYREQPNAMWRNGKGQFTHIKDLYVIHPDAKQEKNIFSGDEHVMITSMFPVNTEQFEQFCDILQVKCLRSDDFLTTPINPKDETVDIMKAIMPKILVLAAISRPEKYQSLYERYVEEIKKYRFLVCDKIDLGYESIHNDIERIYSDDGHVYYVNSWLHNRTYTKFCSKLRSLLGIDVYADVCEDVLDINNSIDECIEKYCSSLVRDESFRQNLQELNHTLDDFVEEYESEEEDDYYNETVAHEEIHETDVESSIPEPDKQQEATSEREDNDKVEQQEQTPVSPTPNKTSRTSTRESTTTSSGSKEDDETIAAKKADLPDKTEASRLSKDDDELETTDETTEDDVCESEKDDTEHTPGEVEGHHRSGCWVNEYWREDGTHVSGHWRSDADVSPHTRELGDTSYTSDSEAEENGRKQERPKPTPVIRKREQEDDDDFVGNVDKDRDYDKLGQRPRKPRARKLAKPYTSDEIERMRSHGTPLELESLPPTQEELDVLDQCGISPEQVADTNYLANLRLYNNLTNELGEEPEETFEEFVRNADDVTVHKLRGGKYIHACSAARGVMYVSPSVWNKMVDDKWIICVYLNGQGSKFKYINSKEEFLQLVEKDDVVIKITGKEKVDVVNELYSGLLEGVKGSAYTLIRVAARTNMDAVFAHYVGAMAEKDDGYDYTDDL